MTGSVKYETQIRASEFSKNESGSPILAQDISDGEKDAVDNNMYNVDYSHFNQFQTICDVKR